MIVASQDVVRLPWVGNTKHAGLARVNVLCDYPFSVL